MSDGGYRRQGRRGGGSGPASRGPDEGSTPTVGPSGEAVGGATEPASRLGPTLASFDRPRSTTATTLAVVADPHCSTRRAGTWKCYHNTVPLLERAIADCNEVGVDALLLAGDLTADGHPADFQRVHDLLATLDAPAFGVPGNHDVPKASDDHETPPIERFQRRFAPGRLPYHVEVGGVDVVGLDTATAPDGALSDRHGGVVGHEQRLWLEEVLPRTETPLVVGHHNLCGELRGVDPGTVRSSYPLDDATALLELLSVHEVGVYCSGHVHLPAVGRRAGVSELVVPPLSTFPQGYALLEVGPAGTTVRFVPTARPRELEESYLAGRDGSTMPSVTVEHVARQLQSLPLTDPQ